MRSVYRTALLLGSLLTLTGCFNRLNTSAIEREIEAEIESQSRRISIDEVRCPTGLYRQAGAYFRCVGMLRPEGQFTINVTQTDSLGNVEWDVPNSQVMLNLAKVEEDLQEAFAKQFSRRASIDCGELYRINQPGEEFECLLIGGIPVDQAQITSLIVKVDPEGNLNWYEVREAIAPVASADASDEDEDADGASPGSSDSAPSETSDGPAASTDEGETSQGSEGIAGSREIKPPRIDP
ncbi:MAG: DUF4333 domain-containing protein [Cyanobacteria bacterium J06639_14]